MNMPLCPKCKQNMINIGLRLEAPVRSLASDPRPKHVISATWNPDGYWVVYAKDNPKPQWLICVSCGSTVDWEIFFASVAPKEESRFGFVQWRLYREERDLMAAVL